MGRQKDLSRGFFKQGRLECDMSLNGSRD